MNEYALHIIMRNDVESLNPGKAMAQASHAYGALKKHIRFAIKLQEEYLSWLEQTPQEFGTTIVKAGNYGAINRVLAKSERFYPNVLSGWVLDPTYPVRDGAITHLIPLETCAYFFGSRVDLNELTAGLDLHP